MKQAAAFLAKRPFLILLLFLLIAYLPVFLPFFHLKNDLITQNLPTRFVISESLYSGHFPWWNPYINFGNPQYGDMNGGYWNPFLWLIANTWGYNIWTITLEEMFYILIGGYGIYLVCREYLAKTTAVIAGISYMGSGFILGHLQHFCWITGAAFFPYVLLFFIRIYKDPVLKNFILGSLCATLFLSATHPGLIIGALYFFAFLIIGLRLTGRQPSHYWPAIVLFLGITLLLSIVVITSDIDVLQHISRGHKISLDDTLLKPTPISSYLSLFFPLAVQNASFSDADIAMRNTYIGVWLLIGLVIFITNANKKIAAIASFIILFFMLLAAGGWFKTFAWRYLPYIGYVRLNGEFSYFVLITMLLAGAYGIDRYKRPLPLRILTLVMILTLFVSFIAILATHHSVLYTTSAAGATGVPGAIGVPGTTGVAGTTGVPASAAPDNWRSLIKHFLDNLSFWDLLLLQSLLLTLTFAFLQSARHSQPRIVSIIAANLVLTCWAILPYTGLGMASKSNRQQLISTFPKGIHPQEQKALKDTRFLDTSYRRDLILLGSYTKKIGFPREEDYPVELNSTERFFGDSLLTDFIFRQSWIFLSKDTLPGTETRFDSSALHVTAFAAGRLAVSVKDSAYPYLTFLQNDYPYWKVKVDGHPVDHFTGFRTFITVPLPPASSHRVEFIFDPWPVRIALVINSLLLALAVLLLSMKETRRWRPFA